jgi:Protein of unknown function (DUF2789)
MDTSTHSLQTLFCQLGLKDDIEQINCFIELHKPLPVDIPLIKAHFWNESQAAFLTEAIESDSDWCALVDKLDSLFREQ